MSTYKLTIYLLSLVTFLSACSDGGGVNNSEGSSTNICACIYNPQYPLWYDICLANYCGGGGGSYQPTIEDKIFKCESDCPKFSGGIPSQNCLKNCREQNPETVAPVTTVTPVAAEYATFQDVTFNIADNALGPWCYGTVHYTTDGTTPNNDSPFLIFTTGYLASQTNAITRSILISRDTTLNYFATDCSGNVEEVKTSVFTINDVTAPTIELHQPPEDDTRRWNINTGLSIKFSERMDLSTITTESISLDNGASIGAISFVEDSNVVQLTLSDSLLIDTKYTVTLSNSILDLAGVPLSEFSWSFTTHKLETQLLLCESACVPNQFNPPSQACLADCRTMFSETIVPVSTVIPVSGEFAVPQQLNFNVTENNLGRWCEGRVYYTTDGTVPDINSPFVTYTNTGVYEPLLSTDSIAIAKNATLNYFAIDCSGNKENIKTETYVINDVVAPTVSLTPLGGEFGSAQRLHFSVMEDNASSWCPGRVYYTTDGSAPDTNSPFLSVVNNSVPPAPITVGPVVIEADSVLKYYAVDCSENTTAVTTESYIIKDITPPSIVAHYPLRDAIEVSSGTEIAVTFSEEINENTITALSFKLDNGTTTMLNYSAITNTAKLIVPDNLSDNTTYTMTLDSSIADLVGLTLTPYSWSFTTRKQASKLVMSDPLRRAHFGKSVSMDGDFAIVGASAGLRFNVNGDTVGPAPGAAYIYRKDAISGLWDNETKISSPSNYNPDHFGIAVAISGDYAIIANRPLTFEVDLPTVTYSAYIFNRTDYNTWDAGQLLVLENNWGNNAFTMSVDISGDYAVVGIPGEDGAVGSRLNDRGAAYIFHRTGLNQWDAGTKIIAPDAQAGDHFGGQVSIQGDYVIVGAASKKGGVGDSLALVGSAYIFHRTGINSWDAGVKLLPEKVVKNTLFGWSVSVNQDYAIVGAFGESAAYIFHRTDINRWDENVRISHETNTASIKGFGKAVAMGVDFAVVERLEGAYYLYQRTGVNDWSSAVRIVEPELFSTGTEEAFGHSGSSISISGRNYVIGAEDKIMDLNDGYTGDSFVGAAYLYKH